MDSFMHTFFGPLNENACAYFLFISMFFFVILVLTLFSELMWCIHNFKKISISNFTRGVLLLFNILIGYFINRLLYSMCTKAL
jgi:hypothetical protein